MKATGILIITILLLSTSLLHSDEIRVGMSTALTGPAEALGKGMRLGIESYFHKVNAAGGINGQQIRLITLDDGYEPDRTAPNMRTLIDREKVVAVIGNVGTPTAIVSVPIANERKTLLFGAFTGAGVLRQTPPDRYVINYRASYAEETSAMIKGLLQAGIKPQEIAFFTQNDGYGDAGYFGAIEALQATGFSAVDGLTHGRYTRNTLNVEEGLGEILDAEVEPKAIIMVGAYAPCAKFIKLARQEFPDILFLNVSFVGSVALKNALLEAAEGVIITQVVPHFNSSLPAVTEYRKVLEELAPNAEYGFVSLEGYIVAKLFVDGLKAVQGEIDSEATINSIEKMRDLDIGLHIKININADEHQASHTIWPTVIENGKFVPLKWSKIKL